MTTDWMPQDATAERAVLGALLLGAEDADAADTFARLKPESFYTPAYGRVYQALGELYDKREPIDTVTVLGKLRELGDEISATAIARFPDDAPTSANLPHYARIVREQWARRQLITVARQAEQLAHEGSRPVLELLSDVAGRVQGLLQHEDRGETVPLRQILREAYKRIEQGHQAEREDLGVQTGFADLDEILLGMRPGHLLVLGGRPSMGKTALALDIARQVAARRLVPLVISLEMTGDELGHRMLSGQARIPSMVLHRPKRLGESDWPKLANALSVLHELGIQVDDTPALTLPEIRAKAWRCRAKHGLHLVLVDYLQLVQPVHRDHSREREVAEISRGLKHLAKELGVPVLCLAQLNREVEKRDSKRPRLADLRESGAVEQDADVVLFVHRPAFYDDKKPATLAEIVIAKQRHGETGVVELHWDAKYTRFSEAR